MLVVRRDGSSIHDLDGAERHAARLLGRLDIPGVAVWDVRVSSKEYGKEQQVDIVLWTPTGVASVEVKGATTDVSGAVFIDSAAEWTVGGKSLGLSLWTNDVNPFNQTRSGATTLKNHLVRHKVEPGFVAALVVLVPAEGCWLKVPSPPKKRNGQTLVITTRTNDAGENDDPASWQLALGQRATDRKCWTVDGVLAAMGVVGVPERVRPSRIELFGQGFLASVELQRLAGVSGCGKLHPTGPERKAPAPRGSAVAEASEPTDASPVERTPRTPVLSAAPLDPVADMPSVVSPPVPVADITPPVPPTPPAASASPRPATVRSTARKRWSLLRAERAHRRNATRWERMRRRRLRMHRSVRTLQVVLVVALLVAAGLFGWHVVWPELRDLASIGPTKVETAVAFVSPERNIACVIDTDAAGPFARCDIDERSFVVPPPPPGCSGTDWGTTFLLRSDQPSHMGCAADYLMYLPDISIQPYGVPVSAFGFSCVVELSGVSCSRIGTGSSFELSRDSFRVDSFYY